MNITGDPRLQSIVSRQPFPFVFATISGAHLYGFPSPDSDYDLRGAHVLPVEKVLGLDVDSETIEDSRVVEGLEMDIVSHDLRKFIWLLLKKNGYVLEQLYSPLVVLTTEEHAELKQIARGCATRLHVHHYLGFADTEWRLFLKGTPRRVKPLLYVYRVLLTGIWLMRTGEIEANLRTLNGEFELPFVPDLIASKTSGPEKSALEDVDVPEHEAHFLRLRQMLEDAAARSPLPETPSDATRRDLNELLVRIRMSGADEGRPRESRSGG